MRPLIQTSPVALWIFIASLVVFVAREVVQSLRRRSEATRHDRGSLILLRVIAAPGFILASIAIKDIPSTTITQGRVPLFVLAMVLFWSGVAIRWWAFHTLGRYFTFTVMTSADQPVITGGPYRFVRHPSYTGVILVVTGLGLAYGNWISMISIAGFTTAALVYRIKVEEAALLAELGDAYRTFAEGRKRLVPGLW